MQYQENGSEFERHEPCPACGSSDALGRYDDGHAYCFVCQYREPSDKENHNHAAPTQKERAMLKGQPVALTKRHLPEETCRKYRIHKDGDTLRMHYFDKHGQVCAAKVKTKDKRFWMEGDNVDHQLFGQNLFPDSGSRIHIYEGELDAASGWEAMPKWPHVSIPNGAAGAKRDIQKVIDLCQGYETVVFFFDNDPPGIQAAQDCAALLPPGKAKIAKMEKYKDASDALQQGDMEAIRRAIYDAKTYRPDGIVEGKSLLELVRTPNLKCAHEYPFDGLNEKLHGIRYGELITVTAGTGSGKTSFCRHLATHLLQEGERVGILELEAGNRNTALGIMSCAVGKPLHIGDHDEKEIESIFESTISNYDLYLFDGFGSFDPDTIYQRIEYMASGLECRIIFLDHISILLSGLDGDERRMIDQTMTRLRSLVERTGITLFLVSHLRRGTNDRTSHEEGGRVSLSSLRGSHSIAQISDTVIALERNQQADSAGSSTTVRLIKNRYSGEVGVACQLSYDLNTCKFNETTFTTETEFNPTTDF